MWLENVLVNTAKRFQTIYGFLQIYHSYYNKKLRVYKLASFTPAYKSLVAFVCQFSRTRQTKFFDVNSEYITRINKFWAKYIEKTVSYLNLFTDFNSLSCISRNQVTLRGIELNWLPTRLFLVYMLDMRLTIGKPFVRKEYNVFTFFKSFLRKARKCR